MITQSSATPIGWNTNPSGRKGCPYALGVDVDPTWVGATTSPSAYGHPFRPVGFVFHPIGVALDWVIMKPFYMLGGLAPEWFGLNTDDAQTYQSHMPELYISKDAPRYRFE